MEEKKEKTSKPYNIQCSACGAPAYYDIKTHSYNCRYCGQKTTYGNVKTAHMGFREIQKGKMNSDLKNFHLQKARCTGCGAEVVFDEGDALANCAFCGRSLVRKAFVNAKDIPELVIPFAIMPEEAKELLADWCKKNSRKKEARAISAKVSDLKGCYLPYELVRGPVDCTVFRIENGRPYDCGGYIDEVFVNCSKELDNRLLDGMEPYIIDDLTEFDFAYVAGHQVKVGDISGDELQRRIKVEVEDDYTPTIQKTLEAKAVFVNAKADDVLRMPVLLPVYYLSFDGFMAAVNGQTGKVSVRAIKETKYVILPWWLKAIIWTIIGTGAISLGMLLLKAEPSLIKLSALCLAGVLLIVLLVAFSENKSKFLIDGAQKIFTSKGGPYIRKNGKLIQTDKEYKKPETKPLFYMTLNGKQEAVELKFTALVRVVRTIAIALLVLFFPVVIALIINGFNFAQINLGGSAAWFCLTVPLTPILLVKYGRIDIYDNPWIYIVNDDGTKKRYKQKLDLGFTPRDLIKPTLLAFIKPPGCLLAWFVLMCFIAMIGLTAFGDW